MGALSGHFAARLTLHNRLPALFRFRGFLLTSEFFVDAPDTQPDLFKLRGNSSRFFSGFRDFTLALVGHPEIRAGSFPTSEISAGSLAASGKSWPLALRGASGRLPALAQALAALAAPASGRSASALLFVSDLSPEYKVP